MTAAPDGKYNYDSMLNLTQGTTVETEHILIYFKKMFGNPASFVVSNTEFLKNFKDLPSVHQP